MTVRWCFTHNNYTGVSTPTIGSYPSIVLDGAWFCPEHDEADSPCVDVGGMVPVREGTELPDPPVDGFCKRPECGCRDAYKGVGKGDNE